MTSGKTKTINQDFYCSKKFTWLSVDLERRESNSCCAATPTKIDLTWLKQNPGKIFNTPLLHRERQQMLDNFPVASCEDACWTPESQGLVSRREYLPDAGRFYIDVNAELESLNIILGSTCNLTCSYCDKQYSTAWLRDINSNGKYLDDPKFNITPLDQVILKVSQLEHQETNGFMLLLDEVSKFTKLKETYITGGEPFLYNNFSTLINNLVDTKEIIVYTGLGVNYTRLQNQLDKINKLDNLTVVVSAENINKHYEFNRYGNSYTDFLKNLNLLKERGLAIKFNAVISNLTIHGLIDFVNTYNDKNIKYSFCHEPKYLGVNVLDSTSIDVIANQISNSDISIKDTIIQNLNIPNTKEQQEQCAIFLKEFARRRNLSLDIFPKSMLQWLSI